MTPNFALGLKMGWFHRGDAFPSALPGPHLVCSSVDVSRRFGGSSAGAGAVERLAIWKLLCVAWCVDGTRQALWWIVQLEGIKKGLLVMVTRQTVFFLPLPRDRASCIENLVA